MALVVRSTCYRDRCWKKKKKTQLVDTEEMTTWKCFVSTD